VSLDLPSFPDVQRVVVTAIYGGIDVLTDPGLVPPNWQRFCFTDAAEHPAWTVVQTAGFSSDPCRSAKAYKILIHRVFPNALYSLWMDANFHINCDLEALVDRYLHRCDVALHPHPERDCVYDEVLACMHYGKDDPATMSAQVIRYALDGFPRHAGLCAGGVILRRHTESTRLLNERWWQEISRGSRRDQLSFNYVARTLDIPYAPFDANLWSGPLFTYRPHGT